jgi:hypothetical protein
MNNPLTRIRVLGSILLVTALSACGGGGGDNSIVYTGRTSPASG